MTYLTALKKTHELERFGIRPGLERMVKLLEALGNPQKALKFIHVAGTNGKGSTVCMTAEILIDAGYKTGMYTSPYVVDFRERIQVNGRYIPKAAYTRCAQKVFEICEGLPKKIGPVTEFEFITAAAFLFFAESKCDVVVLETGLGGRLDATNVIDCPLVSAITSISLDHTDILGDTIEKIAAEKCGIMKNGGLCVISACQNESALGVIYEYAAKRDNRVIMPSYSAVSDVKTDEKGMSFRFDGEEYNLSMCGSYQIENSLNAIMISESLVKYHGFKICRGNIKKGLFSAVMPARFEKITYKNTTFILDCSHNPAGAETLCRTIENTVGNKKLAVICGMLADKNTDGFINDIKPFCKFVRTVTPESPRAMKAQKLAESFKKIGVTDSKPSEISQMLIENVIKKNAIGAPVLVTGSFYVVSPLRHILTSDSVIKQ